MDALNRKVVVALRDLSESMQDNLLLFSSWLNAILDVIGEEPTGDVHIEVRRVIQANMDRGMYRFYSEELLPSKDEITVWLDKI